MRALESFDFVLQVPRGLQTLLRSFFNAKFGSLSGLKAGIPHEVVKHRLGCFLLAFNHVSVQAQYSLSLHSGLGLSRLVSSQ